MMITELPDHISINNPLTVSLVWVLFVLLFWRKLLEIHRYPPGPLPLPVIGNAHFLLAKSQSTFKYRHWRKYGNVVSFVTFGKWNVDLYGFDAIQECLVKHSTHFSERTGSTTYFSQPPLTNTGLIFGPHWKNLKRLALTMMRDHGIGKGKVEDKIRKELEYNLDALAALVGKQSSETFKRTVGMGISNIIGEVTFGHRLDYSDDRLKALCSLDPAIAALEKSKLIPFYKYLPWDPLQIKKHDATFAKVFTFLTSEIQQHKASLDVDQPKDLIDTFLAEGIKNGDPFYSDEESLQATVAQLYIAGIDTTSAALTWALLYLINYSYTQDRIYKEIQQFVGKRLVTTADRASMHFTHAFIHEVLRAGIVSGQTLPHTCTKDTAIQGQNIPAGTTVWANLCSTYHDETVYSDPHSFIPGRFLDHQRKFVKPSGKRMLPFGVGKRICPGESLARTELFIILVSFVQRFEASRASEEKLSEEGIVTLANSPKSFEFNLELRT